MKSGHIRRFGAAPGVSASKTMDAFGICSVQSARAVRTIVAMRPRMLWLCPPILLAALACLPPLFSAAPADLAALKASFLHPPDDARIMMRWWWFGTAVEKPELEREMRAMKEGGIGGFEVQPVYPLTLDDPAQNLTNYPYLSPEFLDRLAFAGEKARQLGLRMDLTLCSGWPYGGPHIPIAQAAGRLRIDRVPLPANATELKAPRLVEGENLFAAFVGSGETYSRYRIYRATPSACRRRQANARRSFLFRVTRA